MDMFKKLGKGIKGQVDKQLEKRHRDAMRQLYRELRNRIETEGASLSKLSDEMSLDEIRAAINAHFAARAKVISEEYYGKLNKWTSGLLGKPKSIRDLDEHKRDHLDYVLDACQSLDSIEKALDEQLTGEKQWAANWFMGINAEYSREKATGGVRGKPCRELAQQAWLVEVLSLWVQNSTAGWDGLTRIVDEGLRFLTKELESLKSSSPKMKDGAFSWNVALYRLRDMVLALTAREDAQAIWLRECISRVRAFVGDYLGIMVEASSEHWAFYLIAGRTQLHSVLYQYKLALLDDGLSSDLVDSLSEEWQDLAGLAVAQWDNASQFYSRHDRWGKVIKALSVDVELIGIELCDLNAEDPLDPARRRLVGRLRNALAAKYLRRLCEFGSEAAMDNNVLTHASAYEVAVSVMQLAHTLRRATWHVEDARFDNSLAEELDSIDRVSKGSAKALKALVDAGRKHAAWQETANSYRKLVSSLERRARGLRTQAEAHFNQLRAQSGEEVLVQVSPAPMRVGEMSVINIVLKNDGEQVVRDVNVTLSGPVDGKLSHGVPQLTPGDERRLLLNVEPMTSGEFALTCSLSFKGTRGFVHEKTETLLFSAARKEEAPKAQQVFNISSENLAFGGNVTSSSQDYSGASIDQRSQTVQGTLIEGNYSQDTVQGDKVSDGAVSLKDSVVKGDVSGGAEGQAAQEKSGGASDIKSRLLQLKELFELDAIDEDEYKARKAKILEEI